MGTQGWFSFFLPPPWPHLPGSLRIAKMEKQVPACSLCLGMPSRSFNHMKWARATSRKGPERGPFPGEAASRNLQLSLRRSQQEWNQ